MEQKYIFYFVIDFRYFDIFIVFISGGSIPLYLSRMNNLLALYFIENRSIFVLQRVSSRRACSVDLVILEFLEKKQIIQKLLFVQVIDRS